MGIAGRYDHYDTFGSAWVGKINAKYDFSDVFAIRATVGNGFHAPSPGQNNTQVLTTAFSPGGEQVQTGTYPVTSSIAQFYGAQLLKPEKSTNFGAGIVITPTPTFTLTIDGYSIKIKNRIGISQTFTVTAANVAALPALASVGVGGDVQYFTNGFDTRTNGVDVVASYRTDLMDGLLNLTFAYSYNKSKVTDFNPSVINADQRYDIGHISPRHRANLGANWKLGDFTLNARENFFGPWAAQQDYPGQKFGSKFVTDLDVSYTFAEHFTLTVGANNLFDAYPDKIAPSTGNPIYALTGSTADGQIYPRNGGPFGINGGFYYARIRVAY
jgi:iron complex outermembrane receptor protein